MNSNHVRDKAIKLINNRNVQLTLKQIAKETGLGEGWLSMFARGQILDPSHYRLQTLYDYLTNKVKI